MFDYFSLIFIVILVLGGVIGFIRGGFKVLARIIVLAVAVITAIFLSKLVSVWIYNGVGGNIHDFAFNFLADKINVEIVPGYTVTGRDPITEAQINTINEAGKIYYTDPNFNMFHNVYTNVGLPQAFWGMADGMLNDAVASYNGAAFLIADPLANIVTNAMCYGIAFLAIFLVVLIVGLIVVFVISLLRKGASPSLVMRIVGAVAGLASAIGIIWAVSLGLNLLMLMENDVSNYLRSVLHMTEGDTTWTFAKWMVTTDFGYSGIISFFIR